MNYIELINHFWQTDRIVHFSKTESYLYFILLNECNLRQWENPFEVSNKSIIGIYNISEDVLIKTRNQLTQKGMICFLNGKRKEKSPVYTLLYSEKKGKNTGKNTGKNEGKNTGKKGDSFKTEIETETETNNIPPNPLKGENVFIPEKSVFIPKKEEKEKSSGKKEKFDLNFVSVAYLTIVKDFIEYRKHIKKPFKTERGVQMFYNELLTLSKNNLQKAQTLVDYAKDKEWQTVYEIKENGKNQSNGATTKERNLESLARNIEQGVARALAEQ